MWTTVGVVVVCVNIGVENIAVTSVLYHEVNQCGKHRCHGYLRQPVWTTVGVVVVCVNIGVENIAVTDIMRSPVWTTVGVVVVCVNIGVDKHRCHGYHEVTSVTVGVVVVCVNIGVDNIAVMDIMRQPVWT